MAIKVPVRTDRLDIEKCVEMYGRGGRFMMIIDAAQRARKIARDNRGSGKFEHNHPVVTVLLDIQDGK